MRAMSVKEDLELEAFRRLYPLQFYERHLKEDVRPDFRPLGRARPTSLSLGTVSTADGSAMARIGNTTMLAGIKLEVMTPDEQTPEEGRIAVDFQMPPICSPRVRPGPPIEEAISISEQLSNVLASAGLFDMKELSILKGKAAWIAYLDIICLDADGALFDAALLAAVGAVADLRVPAVSVTEEGRVSLIHGDAGTEVDQNNEVKLTKQAYRLTLARIPLSLTCVLYKNYLLADPTAEEENVLQTIVVVVLDSSGKLISFYKPGGTGLASTASVQGCIALTKDRIKELQDVINEAFAEIESS